MRSMTIGAALAAGLIIAACGAASARGGSGSGSGLSPYAALSGNDRSAGVNNGNYRDPRLDPYLSAYEGREARPVRGRSRPEGGRFYGYPY